MRNEDIFWLQVPMNNIHLVHVADTLDDLTHIVTSLLLRETLLWLSFELLVKLTFTRIFENEDNLT